MYFRFSGDFNVLMHKTMLMVKKKKGFLSVNYDEFLKPQAKKKKKRQTRIPNLIKSVVHLITVAIRERKMYDVMLHIESSVRKSYHTVGNKYSTSNMNLL